MYCLHAVLFQTVKGLHSFYSSVSESSLKDGLFHEYKKHGKVLGVKVFGQGADRYAVVTFKKPEDAEKALQVSQDKQFFGCRIEVKLHEGLGKFDLERWRIVIMI